MTAGNISQVVDFADACEVTALSLLDAPADLTPERWAGLALVLAFANCDATDHDQRVLLLTLVRRRAGTAFAEALPAALSAISPQWAANVVATLAEAALGHQVDQAVLAWVTSPTGPPRSGATRRRSLAPHDRATLPVLASLARIADRGLPPDDGDSRARWAHAVDLMLLHGPLDEHPGTLASRSFPPQDATSAWAQASTERHRLQPVRAQPGDLLAHRLPAAHPAAGRAALPPARRQGLVDFPPRPNPRPVADISGPGRRGIHSRLPELIAEHLTDAATQELQAPGRRSTRSTPA